MPHSWSTVETFCFFSTGIFTLLLIILLFGMNSFMTFHFYIKNQDISNFIKITATISMVMALISVIIDFVHIERAYFVNKALHKNTFHSIRVAADFVMFLSLLSFFTNLYLRLSQSFSNTQFELSIRFKILCIFLLLTVITLDLMYIRLVLFTEVDETHAHVYGLFTYFHVFYFILIVVKFTHKLREVHLQIIGLDEVLCATCNTQQNDNAAFLIKITTKNTVLSLVALILLLIRFGYRQIIGYMDENVLPEIAWMISYLGRDLVLLATSSFIYLGMKFSSKQYYFVCKYPNKWCYSICSWYMDGKRTKSSEKSEDKVDNKGSNPTTKIDTTNTRQSNLLSVELTSNGDIDGSYNMNIINPGSPSGDIDIDNEDSLHVVKFRFRNKSEPCACNPKLKRHGQHSW